MIYDLHPLLRVRGSISADLCNGSSFLKPSGDLDGLRQIGLRIFYAFCDHSDRCSSHCIRILDDGCQDRMEHLAQYDPVISGNADISRDG